jgi:threonine dehydrogenase-like Zn-dependent dehydrogenase
MRSLAVFPKRREVRLVDEPEPGKPGPNQARLEILEVGICGTDREIAAFEHGSPPPNSDRLVLGHEALARVVEVGDHVEHIGPGDLVVPTVRRPCPHRRCVACRSGRPDFCFTGDYVERGIKEADGFLCDLALEDEAYLTPVPEKLRDVGVLVEPLSIAAKASEQALALQARFPFPLHKTRGLVLGAGPVGVLAAMDLIAQGLEIYVYSAEPATSDRADLVRSFGATYVSAADHPLTAARERFGAMDIVYEAVGVTEIALQALSTLAPNGVCILTGIPTGAATAEMSAIVRDLVLKNQLVVGTVNAGVPAYEAAVRHLEQFMFLFPDSVFRLMSRHPMSEAVELVETRKAVKDIVQVAA